MTSTVVNFGPGLRSHWIGSRSMLDVGEALRRCPACCTAPCSARPRPGPCSGRSPRESPAAVEERVHALEGRVTALAEAVRVLAHGLEDLPATEPGERRAAQADRKAYGLLLVAELRPTPAQPDEGHPGTPDRLPRAVTHSQASPGQWGSRQGRGAGGQRAAPGPEGPPARPLRQLDAGGSGEPAGAALLSGMDLAPRTACWASRASSGVASPGIVSGCGISISGPQVVNAVSRIWRIVSSRRWSVSAMPWLAASWGRSAAACRLSPTWYKPVVIESRRVWPWCACRAAAAARARSARSARLRAWVTSRMTARVKARVRAPVAIATGLRLISAGNVVPSLRSATSLAPAPIGRAVGARA